MNTGPFMHVVVNNEVSIRSWHAPHGGRRFCVDVFESECGEGEEPVSGYMNAYEVRKLNDALAMMLAQHQKEQEGEK